jgi:hypothetical protein
MLRTKNRVVASSADYRDWWQLVTLVTVFTYTSVVKYQCR